MRLGSPSGSSLPLPLHTVLLCDAAGSTVGADLGMWFRHGLNGVRFTTRPMVA